MRDEHQESMGRAIAQLRERQGWSQRELAKWVGLDQSAVSRIEAGHRRVSAQELQRFADTFRVSADALLDGPPGDVAESAAMLPAPAAPFIDASREAKIVPEYSDFELDRAAAFDRIADFEDEMPATHALDGLEDDDMEASRAGSPSRIIPDVAARSALRMDLGDSLSERKGRPHETWPGQRQDQAARAASSSDLAGPGASGPASSLARLDGLPPEVATVVRDWFELRRLAGGHEPALAWSSGHSAEGRPERFVHPVQPAERGSLGGDVLYDRVARFWRSELHVEPDDGPLPDLVPLLEDGLGAQVIVARVGGREAAPSATATPASAERPVCAALTIDATPFIFVNAARPVVLQRFALAHAFAHLVLGHGDVVDGRIHWSRHNPREAAANDFTEEFLAPVRAVHRWFERRGEPRPEVETMLELGNAFGISAWAALYRSRAATRIHVKQFAKLNQQLRRREWELLPQQAFLGGLHDTLTHLTPGECLPPGEYGRPAVLRVPASMRTWALAAVRAGRLSIEQAATYLRLDARELAVQLARLGLE